jgi:membrane protein implicated in regulation of membrane protease activity
MEKIITGILGGEFQRHFWPGFFLNILIVSALFLNTQLPSFDEIPLLNIIAIGIPLAVLTGVIIDYLGHIFVYNVVARQESIENQRITPIVIGLAKKKLEKISDEKIDVDIKLVSEFCFSLTRGISDNSAAQKKYEEQFTYYEFYRSITLFFIPLLIYLIVVSVFKLLNYYPSLISIITIVVYAIIQIAVLLLAWRIFRRKKGKSRVYRFGRWYFASVFSVYDIVTTIQMGILLDYFIRNDHKANPEPQQDDKEASKHQ